MTEAFHIATVGSILRSSNGQSFHDVTDVRTDLDKSRKNKFLTFCTPQSFYMIHPANRT